MFPAAIQDEEAVSSWLRLPCLPAVLQGLPLILAGDGGGGSIATGVMQMGVASRVTQVLGSRSPIPRDRPAAVLPLIDLCGKVLADPAHTVLDLDERSHWRTRSGSAPGSPAAQ
jgi:hypothetical protein